MHNFQINQFIMEQLGSRYETNSNNGLLTVDPNYHDMSSINHTLDSAHAILNIGYSELGIEKLIIQKGIIISHMIVPNGAYKTKHHHFFIEGDLDLTH